MIGYWATQYDQNGSKQGAAEWAGTLWQAKDLAAILVGQGAREAWIWRYDGTGHGAGKWVHVGEVTA